MSNPARPSQYDRPAQQSPDWDPTVADPLYMPELPLQWRPPAAPSSGLVAHPRRTFLSWTFAALVVILAILAAALLVGAPR